jgi:hypothetical protein
LDEALGAAGQPHIERRVIELPDPHRDYHLVTQRAGEAFDRAAVEAGDVVVNVTGGTTAMQVGVERLAERVRRLGVLVRRLALIDRREPAAQREQPYVLAEAIWLDDSRNGEDTAPAESGA